MKLNQTLAAILALSLSVSMAVGDTNAWAKGSSGGRSISVPAASRSGTTFSAPRSAPAPAPVRAPSVTPVYVLPSITTNIIAPTTGTYSGTVRNNSSSA